VESIGWPGWVARDPLFGLPGMSNGVTVAAATRSLG
jgi:hypothetical protein